MSKQLLLVNDTSSSPNQGCQVTMHALNAGLGRFFPEWTVSRVSLDVIARPVTDKAWQAMLPGTPDDYASAVDRLTKSADPEAAALVESFRQADLVIVNGEGSIGENRRTRRLGAQSLFLFLLLRLAHKLDKPVHLINGTIHVTCRESLDYARDPLAECASVTVREPYSYFYTRTVCPQIRLFPDLVCSLEPPGPPHIEEPYVMIGGSSGVNALIHPAGLPAFLPAQYKRICDALAEKGVSVQLMGWARDEYLADIASGSAAYVECDFEKYFSYCAGASFNFTGRHHGIVMAFAAGCPFMTMTSNSYKTLGDAKLYGGVGPVEDFEQFDTDRVLGTMSDILEHRRSYKDAALGRRETMRPFFAGALENILTRREDLVDAGICQITDRPEDYAYDGWHRPSLWSRVTRQLSRTFGA